MAIEVVRALPGDDLSDVVRFRYQVYVDELGWDSPEADHENRVLTDPLDSYGIVHSLVDGGRIVGTLRTVHAAALDDHALIAKTGALDGIEAFGADAVATTSRFMLHPELRGGTAILRLIRTALADGLEMGVRLNYGDTSPHLLPFYEHMGYRRFSWAFNDPNYGWKFPIVMLVRDKQRMEAMRSPVARLLRDHPDDAEARAWFEATYPHSLQERSQRQLGRDGFVALVEQLAESWQQSDVVGELDADALGELLASATVVTARPGDEIVRQGEVGESLFILLSGVADVVVDGSTIAVLTAGALFGEAALGESGVRSASVVAADQCQVVAIDAAQFARAAGRDERTEAAVADGLAQLAAERSLDDDPPPGPIR